MPDFASKFIVINGPEGTGKSTQIERLRKSIESMGQSVLVGTTAIGEQIRAILLNPSHAEMSMRCEMLLYMSSRAQMMAQIILPALNSGKLVLCDRFVSSTLAYQLGSDGLTADEIRAVAQIAISGHWPDLTILLDMPPQESFKRLQREKYRIEQRPLAYHDQVRQNYLAQVKADPAHYRVIDANRSADIVEQEIYQAIQSL